MIERGWNKNEIEIRVSSEPIEATKPLTRTSAAEEAVAVVRPSPHPSLSTLLKEALRDASRHPPGDYQTPAVSRWLPTPVAIPRTPTPWPAIEPSALRS